MRSGTDIKEEGLANIQLFSSSQSHGYVQSTGVPT